MPAHEDIMSLYMLPVISGLRVPSVDCTVFVVDGCD